MMVINRSLFSSGGSQADQWPSTAPPPTQSSGIELWWYREREIKIRRKEVKVTNKAEKEKYRMKEKDRKKDIL